MAQVAHAEGRFSTELQVDPKQRRMTKGEILWLLKWYTSPFLMCHKRVLCMQIVTYDVGGTNGLF